MNKTNELLEEILKELRTKSSKDTLKDSVTPKWDWTPIMPGTIMPYTKFKSGFIFDSPSDSILFGSEIKVFSSLDFSKHGIKCKKCTLLIQE